MDLESYTNTNKSYDTCRLLSLVVDLIAAHCDDTAVGSTSLVSSHTDATAHCFFLDAPHSNDLLGHLRLVFVPYRSEDRAVAVASPFIAIFHICPPHRNAMSRDPWSLVIEARDHHPFASDPRIHVLFHYVTDFEALSLTLIFLPLAGSYTLFTYITLYPTFHIKIRFVTNPQLYTVFYNTTFHIQHDIEKYNVLQYNIQCFTMYYNTSL